jgi:hypothetical protein
MILPTEKLSATLPDLFRTYILFRRLRLHLPPHPPLQNLVKSGEIFADVLIFKLDVPRPPGRRRRRGGRAL